MKNITNILLGLLLMFNLYMFWGLTVFEQQINDLDTRIVKLSRELMFHNTHYKHPTLDELLNENE